MKSTLEEQLESLRRNLEIQLSLERDRLNQELQEEAAANIAEIESRAEESIRKAVQQYETEIAQADAQAKNPSLSFLAERMRISAQRKLEIMVDAHKAIAGGAISKIRNLVK